MVVPDTLFIAEILLYSVGFQKAKNLAFKITRTFSLISEQLRFEQHYDFGLRTIKSVLIYAGQLKLKVMKVKSKSHIIKEHAENKLNEHLGTIKRIQVNSRRHNQPKVKMSSGTAVRQDLIH